MNFFFDECLSNKIVRALAALHAEHTFEHIGETEGFHRGMNDLELIEALARRNPAPILVTSDARMMRKPVERKALADSKLSIVIIKSSFADLQFQTQAAKIVDIWPRVLVEVRRCRSPTALEINAKAKRIEMRPTREL